MGTVLNIYYNNSENQASDWRYDQFTKFYFLKRT